MLLGSFFILNRYKHFLFFCLFLLIIAVGRTEQVEKHTIYPYVHSFSNIPDREAMLRPIKIPDVLPSDLPRTAEFSLVAGEVVCSFSNANGVE
jgi:carnosine N-methyltransferase